MEEIWVDVKNYEGIYQVSNLGRIKSLGNNKNRKEKIRKPLKSNKGYYYVNFCRNGKYKFFQIHRLVAEAFIPNPDNLPQVNHKDENPSNNVVFNLEWCDAKYNNNYGSHYKKVANKLSKPTNQYAMDGQFIAEYPSMIEAARQTGINNRHICQCCKGKQKTAGGYIWKYA